MTNIRITTLLSAVLLLVAVAMPRPGWAQRPPIKIGFTTDLTGIASQPAKDMVNGLQMYLDEIGGQMAGRKIELIVEDSQGQPNVALTTLRKLVEHDRVHVVAGVLFGHLGYALAPNGAALRTVTLSASGAQRLSVVYAPGSQEAVLVGSNLEAPPAGKVYELWYIPSKDAAPAPAGTFQPDAGGKIGRAHV